MSKIETIPFEIEVTKPKLLGNFESFTLALDDYTKQFEIEVTSNNLKEAKESGAKLNKIKKQVKETAKKYLDEAEAPIKAFKEEVKKIESLLETKRLNIVEGINVFEDAKRLEHTQKMNEYMSEILQEAKLREEFYKTLVLPVPSIAGLTSSGSLTKKFRDEIDNIVLDAVEKQRVIDMQAENQRLKDEARAKEIADEMMQKQREQEAKKAQAQQHETLRPIGSPTPKPEPEPKPEPVAQGKSVYRITLTFDVKSKSGIDCEAMMQKVLPMIFDKQIPINTQNCEEM